jgi:hypothetical protein
MLKFLFVVRNTVTPLYVESEVMRQRKGEHRRKRKVVEVGKRIDDTCVRHKWVDYLEGVRYTYRLAGMAYDLSQSTYVHEMNAKISKQMFKNRHRTFE